MIRACLAIAVACVAACNGVAPDLTLMHRAAYEPALSPAAFPGAASMLSGFDERSPGRPWRAGDQVLFGLRLRKGEQTRCWLLHLEVLLGEKVMATSSEYGELPIRVGVKQTWTYTVTVDGKQKELPISSTMLPVAVTVAEADGTALGHANVTLPADLLSAGLLPAVQHGLAQRAVAGPASAEPDDDDVEPLVSALIGMMALLNVVQEDKVLSGYFWQVVEKPGVFSVIANFGVKVSIRMPFENSEPVVLLPDHLPATPVAYAVPLQVDVNANPALLVQLVAADPSPPYALCGGMVAATARHPTDPSLQFDVVLLAARQGRAGNKARMTLEPGPAGTAREPVAEPSGSPAHSPRGDH